jgi:alcohol dehydrogenase (cytochrome c)
MEWFGVHWGGRQRLGARGRMTAFDAATGKDVWRFNTIPMPGEPGAETWKIPESAKHGGGATWTSSNA